MVEVVGEVVSLLDILVAIIANLVDAHRHLTRSATRTLSQWRLSQLVAMAIRASTAARCAICMQLCRFMKKV